MMPEGLGFAQAAALPMAAVTALQGLRDLGRLRPGQRVLVNGASGGVGGFALQIARALGAKVSAVCSAGKAAQARELGAERVFDYALEDFCQDGRQYDLILDIAANRGPSALRRALSPGGVCVVVGFSGLRHAAKVAMNGLFAGRGGKRIVQLSANNTRRSDLLFLNELAEKGKLRPVLDEIYPLSHAAEAFRAIEAGHARGKIVVEVIPEAKERNANAAKRAHTREPGAVEGDLAKMA
ncbi:MAG: NAD(P)-dependent alcohol dehydrogenase [Christensenellaceae bacterium]|jgi:NADPH:quinone reductase-like Zn-dependent oxidoreductase|nr:NAD(P)-dependent alcohol dehydrogenase [Christensenellaceae bacterium]